MPMKISRFPIYFLAILLLGLSYTVYAGEIKIINVPPGNNVIEQYGLLELEAEVYAPYDNPYDAGQIDVTAQITTPAGKIMSAPAFFVGRERRWQIRYTPTIVGEHSYFLKIKTPNETADSEPYTFSVTPGNGNGFIRKSRNNSFYTVFDSGKCFFGLGHNVGWVSENTIAEFEQYFDEFKKNGCNLTRIWINSPWTLCVESKKLGSYDLGDCRIIDSLIRLAEKYGIYIVLSLDSYGSLMTEKGFWEENAWRRNPYNKGNGGPCEKPWDFFTNKTAKKYYKNRLRYIISRWSYSPNILAFELWNEVDTPKGWTVEMLSYIKSINPHGQLTTTSLGYPWSNNFDESLIWELKEVDIAERHVYGDLTKDIIANLIFVNKEFLKRYKKLLLVGEFGLNTQRKDNIHDPEGLGVALHNSIWASALSGSFSGALNWWWEEYMRPNNLYHDYKALRNFVEGVNWNSKNIRFAKTTPVKTSLSEKEEISYSNVNIKPKENWGDTRYKDFVIENNGDVSGGVVNHYLHGYLKKEFKTDPVFHVNYPVSGKFKIDIGIVSQGGELIIYLDGKETLKKEFPAGPGEGPWEKSLYRKDYKVYQAVYNTSVSIDMPAGEHIIRLTNNGKDWIGIKKITLTNYKSDVFANVRVTGLEIGSEILLWIQNKAYNWHDFKKDTVLSPIKGASFDLVDVEDGIYNIEWWDTVEGKITFQEKIEGKNNTIHLTIPSFSKDLACKIKK